jgi:hypothetical protein
MTAFGGCGSFMQPKALFFLSTLCSASELLMHKAKFRQPGAW